MIVLTRYAQKGKDTILCKRNIFKYGSLHSIDDQPISEQAAIELLKSAKHVYIVNVEKKSDLDLKCLHN